MAKSVAVQCQLHVIGDDLEPSQEAQPTTELASPGAVRSQAVLQYAEESEVLIERLDRRIRAVRQRPIHRIATIRCGRGAIATAIDLQIHRPTMRLEM
jgi:hypothetical protein